MQRSLNEISNEIRKAALGAGFPTGHAQELADAAAWLISNRIDCVACVLNSLSDGYVKTATELKFEPSSAGKKQYFLKGINAASYGAGIRDMMIADSGHHSFYLSEIDNPLLLFALLNMNCNSENYSLHWTFSGGNACHAPLDCLKPNFHEFAAGIEKQNGGLNVSLALGDKASPDQTLLQSTSSNGYFVDGERWHQIKAFAAKTYVPASEASRSKGAGAAINDND